MPNLKEIKKIYAGSNLLYPSLPEVDFWMENLTTVVAAYSFIKLKSANTDCCTVRRSSDNTEQLMGFSNNNRLDESAVTNFVGANNGFIASIIDQSGNGYLASQATILNQPEMVKTGVIHKINESLPHARFDLSNDALMVSLPNNTTYYCIASTWSGITHGNFYTASSGQTTLPEVDFFDLLILTNDSEIATIEPLISDRIIDGSYSDYALRHTFHLEGFKNFTNNYSGNPGATWKTSLLNNSNFPYAVIDDWILLKLSNPENVTTFNFSGDAFRGVLPQNLHTTSNLSQLYYSSNYLTGFFPSFENITSTNNVLLRFDNTNKFIGDSPSLNGSQVNNLGVYSLPSLNGKIKLPENCPNLRYFYTYNCNFRGFIGTATNCPILEYLYLHNNQITENLDNLITGTLPALTRLYGYSNQIPGNLPSLSAHTNLQSVHLYSNQLTGVASGFAVSNTLSVILLQDNLLTAAAVNEILVAVDVAGRTSGTLNLGGTGNAAPDGTSGGFDGLTALNNIDIVKSWTVTVN